MKGTQQFNQLSASLLHIQVSTTSLTKQENFFILRMNGTVSTSEIYDITMLRITAQVQAELPRCGYGMSVAGMQEKRAQGRIMGQASQAAAQSTPI
jgi:hypothetical protein